MCFYCGQATLEHKCTYKQNTRIPSYSHNAGLQGNLSIHCLYVDKLLEKVKHHNSYLVSVYPKWDNTSKVLQIRIMSWPFQHGESLSKMAIM